MDEPPSHDFCLGSQFENKNLMREAKDIQVQPQPVQNEKEKLREQKLQGIEFDGHAQLFNILRIFLEYESKVLLSNGICLTFVLPNVCQLRSHSKRCWPKTFGRN